MTPKFFGARPWFVAPRLAGYEWRATQSVGAVLLQHGYAEYAGRYVEHHNRLVPQLLAKKLDVYAFDMAGHGLSSGQRGITDIEQMVCAHIQGRRLLAGLGKPLFLFGHSLGGLVTAASVTDQPDQIAGVILSGPALPSQASSLARFAARAIAAVAPGMGISPLGDPTGISRIKTEVEAYVSDPLIFQRKLPAKLGATALAASARMWPRLPNWRAPTLIMHGAADTSTDPRGSQELLSAIGADDKRLCLVEHGRHELLNDVPREDLMSLALAWIEQRCPVTRGADR